MRIIEPPTTPSLVIDYHKVRSNLERLARYTECHGLQVRPHTKTHKSVQIAKMQLEAGAVGLSVAKAGEAEAMVQAFSFNQGDMLVAFPALDASRTSRLAKLARFTTIRVAVDSSKAADALEYAAATAHTTIGILVDVDCGFHRTGVQSPQEAVKLALYIEQKTSLRLDGLFLFPGHLMCVTSEQRTHLLKRIQQYLEDIIELWRKQGLEATIISGGSTPTAYQSHKVPALTEIRPGTYVFNDMNTVYGGFCDINDCAAQVICTVVSNAVSEKFVIDAGSKALSSDLNLVKPSSGFGYVLEYPRAVIERLSEEHGEVSISECDRKPQLGERLTVVPNHVCVCVNLQESAWLRCDNGMLQPLSIDAQCRLN